MRISFFKSTILVPDIDFNRRFFPVLVHITMNADDGTVFFGGGNVGHVGLTKKSQGQEASDQQTCGKVHCYGSSSSGIAELRGWDHDGWFTYKYHPKRTKGETSIYKPAIFRRFNMLVFGGKNGSSSHQDKSVILLHMDCGKRLALQWTTGVSLIEDSWVCEYDSW